MVLQPLPRSVLLDAALAYAKRGWRVIPIIPGGKRPILDDWPNEASTDPPKITEWWFRSPASSIGIVTDRAFGWALDVDNPAVLEVLKDLPPTLTARTPSGGTHLIFQHPTDRLIKSRSDGGVLKALRERGFVPDGNHSVDVRGSGGQIVVAPSTRKDGRSYAWVDLETPIAEAPKWFLDMVTPDIGDVLSIEEKTFDTFPDRPLTSEEASWLRREARDLSALTEGRYSALYFASMRAGKRRLPTAIVFETLFAAAESYIREKDDARGARRQIRRGWAFGQSHAGFGDSFLKDFATNVRDCLQSDTKPQIRINGRDLVEVIQEAWAAEAATGATEESLFLRSDRLVTMRAGTIADASSADVFGRLIRVAQWGTLTKDGNFIFAKPPIDVVNDIIALPRPHLPEVEAVISTPIVDAAGDIVRTPGHHQRAKIWFHPTVEVDVPDNPTITALAAARSILLDDLFFDFPFVSEADQTHAVALLLLPFARRLIDGVTPLHLIEAPTQGSGKGLIARIISLVFSGREPDTTVLGHDEYSVQQKITAALRQAPAMILLDNVKDSIESSVFAAGLTADPYYEREMRTQNMIRLPNKATWMATANNPRLSLDIARRTARIRIAPTSDRPWQREGSAFKHHPLPEWVLTNRQALIKACLVIIRNWIVMGRPPGTETLGSFENWARVMGGILQAAGFNSFLANANDLYAKSDPESQDWEALIDYWHAAHGERLIKAKDVLKILVTKEILPSILQDAISERAQTIRVGKALLGMRDRWFAGKTIIFDYDKHEKTTTYKLAKRA